MNKISEEALASIILLVCLLTLLSAFVGILKGADYLSDSGNRKAGRYVAQQCYGSDQDCIVYCDRYAPYNGDAACVKEIKRLREQDIDKDA